MMKAENQFTKISLEADAQRSLNDQMQISLEELKKQVMSKEKELDDLEAELAHCKSELCKKQGQVDALYKKLEQTTTKTGQV